MKPRTVTTSRERSRTSLDKATSSSLSAEVEVIRAMRIDVISEVINPKMRGGYRELVADLLRILGSRRGHPETDPQVKD